MSFPSADRFDCDKDFLIEYIDVANDAYVGAATIESANGNLTVEFPIAFEASGGGYTEVAYTEKTTDTSITATTAGTANTIVTASAFTADGSDAYLIEWFASAVQTPSSGVGLFVGVYVDGSVEAWIWHADPSAAATHTVSAYGARRLVLASGSRTISIRGIVTSGTGNIVAGAGGGANFAPTFVRVTKLT